MWKETVIFGMMELGIGCQVVGICIATWTLRDFVVWVKSGSAWFTRFVGRLVVLVQRVDSLGNTATVDVKVRPPKLFATMNMSEEVAAVHKELNELMEEVRCLQGTRGVADKRFDTFARKAKCGAGFLVAGTILVAVAEGVKFYCSL